MLGVSDWLIDGGDGGRRFVELGISGEGWASFEERAVGTSRVWSSIVKYLSRGRTRDGASGGRPRRRSLQ